MIFILVICTPTVFSQVAVVAKNHTKYAPVLELMKDLFELNNVTILHEHYFQPGFNPYGTADPFTPIFRKTHSSARSKIKFVNLLMKLFFDLCR